LEIYLGEIMLIPNAGSGAKPDYRQPSNIASVIIPTMKDSLKKWENMFAPAVWDWNKDRKDDLLVGEGSYSANSIHLLLNQGSGGRPIFDENNRSVLAYGMGLEQLTPCIVDYNGDGLFDLVFGKSNGKIAIPLNSGSKTEPKFGAPVEVKGSAVTPAFNSPSGRECDFGLDRGNFHGFFSVAKEADDPEARPAEGVACLKAGYIPSPNTIMPVPTRYSPAFGKTWSDYAWDWITRVRRDGSSNFFSAVQSGRSPLKTGTSYIFSMKVKGNKVNAAAAGIYYHGYKKLSEEKIERGDRGSVTVKKNEAEQRKQELVPFNVGSQWTEVRKELTVKFDDKNLADLTKATSWSTAILFTLGPGSNGGTLYVDDVKIIEK